MFIIINVKYSQLFFVELRLFYIVIIFSFNTGLMRIKSIISYLSILFSLACISVGYAKQPDGVHAKNGMNANAHNYTSFSAAIKNADAEVLAHNAGYETHAETGMLFAETPCDNCYELIGDRTEMSKTFKERGVYANGQKKVYCQTSSKPMHYRDAAGNWRTIQAHLSQTGVAGVYAAEEQEVPVRISAAGKFTSVGKAGQGFRFNSDLELIYQRPDGLQVSLGKADWSHHTAGDDGLFVTNAWPGIDMEVYVARGMTKTNFFINHAMPEYADGRLLVRDHMQMDAGLSLAHGSTAVFSGILSIKNAAGGDMFFISPATAAEKHDSKATLRQLDYLIDGNTVDIALPGDFLNRSADAYPVIIDPLVSTATVSPVTGSTYSTNWTVPCVYSNAATVPANCTITDIQWSFNYITSGGAWLDEGAVDFRLGTCRSPTGTTGVGGFYWFCNLIGSGTCTGTNISIYSDISSCVPAPQCPSYNLNMTMDFYQNYLTTAPCATTYVSGATPLTITVIGHTVEINPVVITGGSTICAGQSTTLSTSAIYGVPPYTFSWSPGGLTGSPVTVSPTATTTYTATVTDACGITATATSTITVNPAPPITGTMSVCVGGNTALSNTTGGGTWSSSAPGVATVSGSGVVYGVSAGTTIITYITPAGCSDTALVTVNLLSPISGPNNVCVNSTITLSNTLAGGTWTSSNTAIATVGATGVVGGASAGTVTIVYTAGTGCSTSYAVTVNPLPTAISGPGTVCQGSTIVLSSTPASGTWSSSATSVATVSGGTVGGVAAGVATITYTLPTACYTTKDIVVYPIYSSSFNITVCAGGSYTFAGTTYNATGVYPHVFPTVNGCDSVVALHLTVQAPIFVTVYDSICAGSTYTFAGNVYNTAGTYTHTFTTPLGCDSNVTLNLFVKPLPPAPTTANVDLCQNASPVFPLTAVGSNLVWYTSSSGGFGTVVAPIPPVATAGLTTWYVSQVVNGCEGPRAPLTVNVHNRPNFNIVPGKPYECQFDTISLNYGGPMFPGIQFAWTIPGYATLTAGALSDPSIVVRFDTSLGGNTASLTISDGYLPCASTMPFDVPVFLTAPPASFTTNSTACVGDSVLVALNFTSPGINDYLWNFGGGRVVKHSSNHGGPYNIVWDTAGVHVITMSAVTNANCPATTVKDTIMISDRPDASIAPYSVVGGRSLPCTGDSILFSPLHFDSRYSYHWSPEHNFTTQNNYSSIYGAVDWAGYVKLSVTTPFGCDATDSIYVDAQPCCTISFPTAFTPNNDHKNDIFRPIMTGHHKIHFFRVENRWGQVVYESREESKGSWDGNFNGEPQDMGVYFYYVIYDCAGTNQTAKGEVTLIR